MAKQQGQGARRPGESACGNETIVFTHPTQIYILTAQASPGTHSALTVHMLGVRGLSCPNPRQIKGRIDIKGFILHISILESS